MTAEAMAELQEEIQDLRSAISHAAELLSRPHKHNWRPDLVACGAEQDALSILLSALLTPEANTEYCDGLGRSVCGDDMPHAPHYEDQ